MRILAINVEIGLGHPNYLDYVLHAIKKQQPKTEIDVWDVLTDEKGLTKIFWQISKRTYSIGAKGGLITDFYNKFRNASNMPNISLCHIAKEKYNRILVSHPMLARYLECVWYIHGEIAAPRESILTNVQKIIVPIDYTAKRFISQGLRPAQILQTGLLISPDLITNAKENYLTRLSRIKSDKPLTIGFFISGAYPPAHIQKLIAGIISVVKQHQRIIVFLGTNANKAKQFLRALNRKKKEVDVFESTILFLQGKTRLDYQKRVNNLLPLLDVFIAPSHEHTNWAIGLGLPMFVLFPMIGSYAEENYKFAEKQEVAYPLKTLNDAGKLGETVQRFKSSRVLEKMVENGFDKFPIDGAIKTAKAILEN